MGEREGERKYGRGGRLHSPETALWSALLTICDGCLVRVFFWVAGGCGGGCSVESTSRPTILGWSDIVGGEGAVAEDIGDDWQDF